MENHTFYRVNQRTKQAIFIHFQQQTVSLPEVNPHEYYSISITTRYPKLNPNYSYNTIVISQSNPKIPQVNQASKSCFPPGLAGGVAIDIFGHEHLSSSLGSGRHGGIWRDSYDFCSNIVLMLFLIWRNSRYLSILDPGCWLTYPSEKYESVEIVKFPTEWKNKIHLSNHQPASNLAGQFPISLR